MVIVEFRNGKFAVKRGWWIFSLYLSHWRGYKHNFLSKDNLKNHCLFYTYHEANDAYIEYIKLQKEKELKIVKVYR